MLQAVLFDVDGTLVDSNQLHAEAWSEAFRKFGLNVPAADVQVQIGKGGDQLLPVFLNEKQRDEFGEELTKFRGELFRRDYMAKAKPFPGVRELFQRILQHGLKISLATSAKDEELKQLKKIAGIENLIHEETKSDDVERSKPYPDIFSAALEKLGVEADHALAIGDTPWDVQACNKIHLRTVAFTCGGWKEQDLRDAGAIEVFGGPEDLLKNYEKSALAEPENQRAA